MCHKAEVLIQRQMDIFELDARSGFQFPVEWQYTAVRKCFLLFSSSGTDMVTMQTWRCDNLFEHAIEMEDLLVSS